MSRKKKHEHVNHERWLVSYADFITLLFAFFVVMFATSQQDKKKMADFAQSIQSAFNDSALFQAHSDKPPLSDQTPITPPAVAPAITPQAVQQQIQQELETALSREISENSVSIHQTEAGLVISLREAGFFAAGSADIQKQSLPALNKIGMAIAQCNNNIRVEGHTDDRPIHNAQFESNWELSTARATRIARFFMQLPGTDAARFSAAGYAQYRPVADNDTEAGRMQNRRVDVVLLPPAPTSR
jgi:chemotaxis protein MotB